MDGVKEIEGDHRRACIGVVFKNPFAGQYEEDLSGLSDWAASVGTDLVERALKAAGIEADQVESYGKAAIIGGAGGVC